MQSLRRLRRLRIALRLEQCSEVAFKQEWEKLSSLLEQDVELEARAVVTPVYMGDVAWRHEWADWVLWYDNAMKVLRRKTHVNVRRDVREAWNKRELKVKELIAINKWKGVIQKYLKKPFSSGDKRVLLVGSEA